MSTPFNIAPEVMVFFASMIPFLEITGAIPLGIALGMASTAVIFWAMAGNFLFSIVLLKGLDPVTKFLMSKIKFVDRYLTKFFTGIHRNHSKRFNEIGIMLLFLFVAIPGPGTGTYTSVAAAYLFKAPFWPSLIAIMLGNLVSSILLVEGINIFKFLIHLLS